MCLEPGREPSLPRVIRTLSRGGPAALPGDLRQLGGCVNILAQPGNREAAILHYSVSLDTVAAASVADAA